ncbi:MAG TPA: guanylate kinase [Gemmataceae bacterium]|nr:guanylate kinase [Gemmataceae bacterium]
MAPLIIVSGPSGCGKTTILRHLLQEGAWPMRLSVSATTRAKRPKETDGVDYHFWTVADFLKEKDADGFLEWAKVHDNYYGTLVREVTPFRENGVGVLLDIDVQGAALVRQRCPDAVSIFVRTSRFETLEERLRARHTESEPAIQKRLANARAELARAGEYQHQVINDDLETAFVSMRAILGPLFPKE